MIYFYEQLGDKQSLFYVGVTFILTLKSECIKILNYVIHLRALGYFSSGRLRN